jgi:hypothetical protein
MKTASARGARALACGAVLLLFGGGCSLVDRAGQDLQNAGSNITHSADWVRNKLGGGPAVPPMTAGHSPGAPLSPEGSSVPPPDGTNDLPCGWANIKPNC